MEQESKGLYGEQMEEEYIQDSIYNTSHKKEEEDRIMKMFFQGDSRLFSRRKNHHRKKKFRKFVKRENIKFPFD